MKIISGFALFSVAKLSNKKRARGALQIASFAWSILSSTYQRARIQTVAVKKQFSEFYDEINKFLIDIQSIALDFTRLTTQVALMGFGHARQFTELTNYVQFLNMPEIKRAKTGKYKMMQ